MKIDYFEKFRDRIEKNREDASLVLEQHEKKKQRPEPQVKPETPVKPANNPTKPAKESKNGKN